MDPSKNLQNMKKLDDSWNAQDLETFSRYHTKDCIVRWPNQPPTHGRDAHEQEAIAFLKNVPRSDLVNNTYKIMVAQGEWTCTLAEFSGTMKGPMSMPND
jgi:ketosteroid isomerase-like protein